MSRSPQTVLVTGGTGFVGRAIALAAAEAGHRVRVLARDRRRAVADFPRGTVDVVEGEILGPGELAHALDGVDTVVHAAATYSYERRHAQRMIEENPRLTERVLSLARAAGVRLVVDVSSGIVLRGHREGPRAGITDESSPLWDASDRQWADPYLRSKVLAEHVARRFAAGGLPITSLHPVNTVGPGDRGPGVSGGVLVRMLRNGAVLPDAASGWVDVRDVALAAVEVLDRPAGGRHVLAAVSEPWRDTARRLDALTGSPRRRLFLPARATRALVAVNDRLGGRLVPGLPPSVDFALTLGRVDGASGLPALGLAYRPFESTLRDALEWWATNGALPASATGRLASR